MKLNRRWLALVALVACGLRSWSRHEWRRVEERCGQERRLWLDHRLGRRGPRAGHGCLHQVAPEREGDEGHLRR